MPSGIPEEEEIEHQPKQDRKEMRRLPIRAQDFARIGYTDGCPGCRSCITGDKVQGHTDACRQRVMAELRRIEDPRVEREVRRITGAMEDRMSARVPEGRHDSDGG